MKVMKKSYFLLIALSLGMTKSFAQDDDVYYVPSAESRAAERAEMEARSSYTELSTQKSTYDYADPWAEGRSNNGFDVDAYNRRRGSVKDTVDAARGDLYEDSEDAYYTSRLVRFHAPSVGILISSPFYGYYSDFWGPYGYYSLYDPWFDDWSWHRGYYYGGWGYYRPWGWYGSYYNWYSPRWYGGWYGWDYPYYWRRPYIREYYHDMAWQRGPANGGRSFSVNGRRINYNNNGTAPSRGLYGNNRSMNGRSYGNQNARTSSRAYETRPQAPSRSYDTQPSRGYSAPSRSYSPSVGGGNGRSYGGGNTGGMSGGGRSGGRSFGR